MKEIGGYIELDTYRLPMLHEGAVALNCGRNALAYIIKAREIKKLWLPRLLCDSVPDICKREGVPFSLYGVGTDFLPVQEFSLGEGEWLYLVNYYSQITNERISDYVKKYERVIVDNAQSYFQLPIPGVDTFYTCRKYFGVADGAFLYTDAKPKTELKQDESHEHMGFLLGRYERPAGEFYGEYTANNKRFTAEPVKSMSKLTDNLLHGIDYEEVERCRRENFAFLHEKLGNRNLLTLNETGTFMYPFMTENGRELRSKLQAERIFVPTLWPAVFEMAGRDDAEYKMAENILPIPIDQRYGTEEMSYIIERIQCLLG